MTDSCPRCGSETVVDDGERLCLNNSDETCFWWKNLETGAEYPPEDTHE